jgi:endonuclease/exonuclease/phosphatase (EEP) superfamily protein YafD
VSAPADERHRHTGGGRLVDTVAPPLLAVLALVTGSRWADATGSGVLPLLQALVPAASVPTWAVLLATAFTRRWRLAAAAAGLATVHVGLLVPWVTRRRRRTVGDRRDRLVVLSSNLQLGRGDPAALVETVRARDVDLLLLVEVTLEMRAALLEAGITDVLPHMAGTPSADTDIAMIFSRHPLREPDVAPLPPIRYGSELSTVETPSGDVVAAVVHPVVPIPIPGPARAWHRELAGLAAWAASVPRHMPVVLAGDFNATMDHPVLRRLGAVGIVDAHREVGRGRRATWPRIPGLSLLSPLFHLDHVQARGFDVVDADTLVMPGSDHLAVWAELAPAR